MKKIFSFILACITMTSCVDTVILPDDKILDEDYWMKKSEVDNLVSTAYSQLRGGDFLRNMVVWTDFRSDELKLAEDIRFEDDMTRGLKEIESMLITPENMFTSWAPLYSAINYCNLIQENIGKTRNEDPNYTQGDYDATMAQVVGLRSLCYFYLVRCFRDVPLTPHAYTQSSEDLSIPQSAPTVVLQKCIDDLLAVADNAPVNNAFYDSRDRGYFNKDGIYTLLADIYLWRASVLHDNADYQRCIECCDKVIDAKKAAHILLPNETPADFYFNDIQSWFNLFFVSHFPDRATLVADEFILSIQGNPSSQDKTTPWTVLFSDKNDKTKHANGYLSATPAYGIVSTTNIYREATDERIYQSVYNANNAQATEFKVRKYNAAGAMNNGTAEKTISRPLNPTYDWVVYRFTDVILMKAEALAILGEEKAAYDLVRVVNDRAISDDKKLSSTMPTKYVGNMEELVMLERARELCFESKRWFDLLRFNYRRMTGVKYDQLLSQSGEWPANSKEFFDLALAKYSSPSSIAAKMPSEPYLYMPINQVETEVNPKLNQNPVYHSVQKK